MGLSYVVPNFRAMNVISKWRTTGLWRAIFRIHLRLFYANRSVSAAHLLIFERREFEMKPISHIQKTCHVCRVGAARLSMTIGELTARLDRNASPATLMV